MKIGLYPMVADILHTGHVLAIEEAKKNCDYLIVALHCNPTYKTPVQSIYERFIQLRSIKWIDEIIPYENLDDIKIMMKSLNYDIYFLGEDYKGKDWEGSDILKELHKDIIFISRRHDFSSTNLKERLKEDDD